MKINDFFNYLTNLRLDKSGGLQKPYQPILLMSVIINIARGNIRSEYIFLNDNLRRTYRALLDAMHPNWPHKTDIVFPFRALESHGVWDFGLDGRQCTTSVGRIDLLGFQPSRDLWWVFELKRGNLASKPSPSTTWYWVFNHVPQLEFSKQQLIDWLSRFIALHEIKRVSTASLKRDVDSFIRTYLFAKKLTASGYHLNLGTSSGPDVASVEEGVVAAEVFAAVDPKNNRKLKKDIDRVAQSGSKHRFVFYYSPTSSVAPEYTIDGVTVVPFGSRDLR